MLIYDDWRLLVLVDANADADLCQFMLINDYLYWLMLIDAD